MQYDLRARTLAGLVERGLISTGRAAELAGLSRREFRAWYGRWHVGVIMRPNTSPLTWKTTTETARMLAPPGE